MNKLIIFLKKNSEILLVIGFLLLASFFICRNLDFSTIQDAHDDVTHAIRIKMVDLAIHEGNFPPRWEQHVWNGFGSPYYIFYGHMFYYLAEIFVIIGFGYFFAINTVLFFGFFLSGIFMYLLAREFFNRSGALVAAIGYMTVPYHLVDLFVRGAYNEFFSFVFIPLIILSIYKLFVSQKYIWSIILGLAMAFLVLTHTIVMIMVLPMAILFFIFFWILYRPKFWPFVKRTLLALLFAVLFSAWNMLPFLESFKDIDKVALLKGETSQYNSHFICARQFTDYRWSYGNTYSGCEDDMPLQLGKIHVMLAVISLLALIAATLMFYKNEKHRKKLFIFWFFYFGFAMVSFLMTRFSDVIWQKIVPLQFLQFPWRWLVIAAFINSFVIGIAFIVSEWLIDIIKNDSVKKIMQFAILCISILVIVAMGYKYGPYMKPSNNMNYAEKSELSFEENMAEVGFPGDYIPLLKSNPYPRHSKGLVFVGKTSGSIIEVEKHNHVQRYLVNVKKINEDSHEAVIESFWFKGWNLYIDGQKISPTILSEENTPQLELTLGKHEILWVYERTLLMWLGDICLILGIVGTILFCLQYFINKQYNNHK